MRIELLGDTVESLREFDPETQRSTGPVSRVIASAADGVSASRARHREWRDAHPSDGLRVRRGREAAGAARTLFDLREDTLVVLDEPEAIRRSDGGRASDSMADVRGTR